MQQIRRSGDIAVSVALTNEDGGALTALTVSATVTDPTGTEIGPLNATETSGTYSVTVPDLDVLGVYTVEWTWTGGTRTTAFELVGDHLFEIGEMRDFADEISGKSASDIRRAREEASEIIEQAAEVAFRLRGHSVRLEDGRRRYALLPHFLPHRIVSVTDWVSGDIDGLVLHPTGRIEHATKLFASPVTIVYEHGYLSPPSPVRKAAMQLALERLSSSALPSRATSEQTEVGAFRLSIADPSRGRFTGIPDVDAVIAEFGKRSPLLA